MTTLFIIVSLFLFFIIWGIFGELLWRIIIMLYTMWRYLAFFIFIAWLIAQCS